MDDALRQSVWQRAGFRREYCQLPQEYSILLFEIDHVIARKHRGKTILSNLALCCFYDNSFKGSDIASIDPASGK
jgi:HNH endonuclease